MRKMLIGLGVLAILAGASAALAVTTTVDINGNGFNPRDVSIQSGDSVSWKNSDTVAHRVSVAETPCRLNLAPAQTGSCTFASPGTFTYTDPSLNGLGFSGTVTVAKNSRSVSLASSRSVAIFGGGTTLSGTVSSKQPGETVTVVAQPVSGPTWQTQVTTTAGGNWSLQVQPLIRTSYKAEYQGVASTSTVVDVRPRVSVQKVGKDRFLVVVLAAHSMAGKMVDITRWNGHGWDTFSQLPLRGIARTPTIAVIYFTSHVRLGKKLRVFLPATQAAPDYVDGHSNVVVR